MEAGGGNPREDSLVLRVSSHLGVHLAFGRGAV